MLRPPHTSYATNPELTGTSQPLFVERWTIETVSGAPADRR